MKIFIFFVAVIFGFSYELVVSNEFDKNKLEDFGFICSKKKNLYVCLSSNNVKDLMKIKSFLKTKFNINCEIIDDNSFKKISLPQRNYCIQVGSFKYIENAKKMFQKYKNLPFARIEKIRDFYSVRIGFNTRKNIIPFLKKVNGIVKECSLLPDRIVISNFNSSRFNKYNQSLSDKKMLVSLGDLYFRKNKLDKALNFYRKSLNISPDNLSVLRKIELIYVKKRNCKKAEEYADKIIYLQFKNEKLK